MKNTQINKKIISKIAMALEELNAEVIYVGGATVSLYINDPAAEDVRPTKDVDISLQIATLAQLEELREKLSEKGFKQTSDLDVICRFRYDDILVDVMGTKEIGWAPANPWFEEGFQNRELMEWDGTEIYIMPLSYFLASKFTAHEQRGGTDPRMSHDYEDIVYILDNRIDLHELLIKAEGGVKAYLIECFKKILASAKLQEAIMANLYYETQAERFESIIEKLKKVISESE